MWLLGPSAGIDVVYERSVARTYGRVPTIPTPPLELYVSDVQSSDAGSSIHVNSASSRVANVVFSFSFIWHRYDIISVSLAVRLVCTSMSSMPAVIRSCCTAVRLSTFALERQSLSINSELQWGILIMPLAINSA